jgi:hypothetical protein
MVSLLYVLGHPPNESKFQKTQRWVTCIRSVGFLGVEVSMWFIPLGRSPW